MNLLLIILSLTIFSFIPVIFPKLYRLCIVISIIIVLSSYFFISKNFFFPKIFFPSEQVFCSNMCFNYYNLLAYSLKNKKLHIGECDESAGDIFFYKLKTTIEGHNGKQKITTTILDTSVYKNKVYLYFGITPVLLFYLPFNLATGMFLTDKIVGFGLGSLIFLLSLFLIKVLSEKFCVDSKLTGRKYLPIHVLSVFLLGFCSLVPFILMRVSIYEVAILTAIFLLITSFVVLFFYLKNYPIESLTLSIFCHSNILVFCLGLFLSLAVGARPHYVFFIPIFFAAICIMNYYHTQNIRFVIKQAIIFLMPCVIIGTGLALYNYLRFDSVFDFGFNCQVKPTMFSVESVFKELLEVIPDTLKQTFFKLPDIDTKTFISLVHSSGHKYGNAYIAGIFWMCPIMIVLLFVTDFLKNIYKKDKTLFAIISVMCCVILINLTITTLFGVLIRYTFEYFLFVLILSIIMFYYYLNNAKDKLLKRFINIVFIMIFAWSMFVNISLMFCGNNFKDNYDYIALEGICYKQIVDFLF